MVAFKLAILFTLATAAISAAGPVEEEAAPDCDLDGGWYGNANFGICYYTGPIGGGNTELPYLDWFGARDYCADKKPESGSFLATIKAQYQNDLLRFEIGGEENINLWIAANDLTNEGVWEWDIDSNGGTGDFLAYKHWSITTSPEQPDNVGENEDCAILVGDDHSYWYDVDCTLLFQPLCAYIPAGAN